MTTVTLPWYREIWPWFIISLLGSCVVACMLTLAIAIHNPDYLVVSEVDYEAMKAELRNEGQTAGDGGN